MRIFSLFVIPAQAGIQRVIRGAFIAITSPLDSRLRGNDGKKGFSLVELSIVLVILGLLTGGILAGQSLIRAAELRSVTTEYSRYIAAMHTFRDKYMALPGDMPNATRFWGDDNAQCPDAAIPNGTPGTCNGNGNGVINRGTNPNATSEIFRFWQQLALAGLIEGTYSGNAGSIDAFDADIGINIPPSKLTNGSWYAYNGANWTWSANTSVFDGVWGDFLQFGAVGAGNTDNAGRILSPEEAWNIDTKLDDGRPAYGKLVMRSWSTCTTAASSADLAANYALTAKGPQCVLMFVNFTR